MESDQKSLSSSSSYSSSSIISGAGAGGDGDDNEDNLVQFLDRIEGRHQLSLKFLFFST